MVKKVFITLLSCFMCSQSYSAEFFVNLGVQNYDATVDSGDPLIDNADNSGSGAQLSLGIRGLHGKNDQHALGTGIDIYEITDYRLIGFRAIDYQYQFGSRFRIGGFFGAASLDSGLPQNGYYTGVNFSALQVIPYTDILLEFRHGSGLARDTLLENDPEGERVDMFLDFNSLTLALNWRF